MRDMIRRILVLLCAAWSVASCGGDGGSSDGDQDMGADDAGGGGDPAPDMAVKFGVSPRDFNGDDFDDVLVGAPGSTGAMPQGYVNVYFGADSPTLDGTADRTLVGESSGDQFGKSVAAADDFNDDSYADIIVGSPGDGAGGTSAGRVDIFFGGPGATFDDEADWTVLGATDDRLGASVSSAGDLNGDDIADVVVGAPGSAITGPGKALVFLGESDPGCPPTIPCDALAADASLTGNPIDDYEFGQSVSAADLDGDGFDDVIVGAPGAPLNGIAYVFNGGAGAFDPVSDEQLAGTGVGEDFGYAVLGLSDTNGDGVDDVAVGAWHNGGGGANAGAAYVFFGGTAGVSTVAAGTIYGAGSTFFGATLGTGDFNGDGLGDLAVGHRFMTQVRVYLGVVDALAFDDAPDRVFGGSTSIVAAAGTVGDVNHDGFDEVIVGGPSDSTAIVYFGANPLDGTSEGTLMGVLGDMFGDAVAWSVPSFPAGAPMCVPPRWPSGG